FSSATQNRVFSQPVKPYLPIFTAARKFTSFNAKLYSARNALQKSSAIWVADKLSIPHLNLAAYRHHRSATLDRPAFKSVVIIIGVLCLHAQRPLPLWVED